VFKSFLKVERDAPALVVLGSSFHQRGTTNENSLDCRACTDGSAKRRSLDERSVLGVTFALVRANVTPRMLRSSSERRLALPSVQVRQSRLFSFVVPRWWNELPSTTRAGASLSTFKKLLKTQLFREHFPS